MITEELTSDPEESSDQSKLRGILQKKCVIQILKERETEELWIKGDKRGQLNAICDNRIQSQTRGLKRHFFF